mgnify:FL=1
MNNDLPIKIKLPDGFLEPEVRCDYQVTKELKELWAVELDLLSELLRICYKYKITIFANGGTMLGAVRHKGFIPWDDDIDMMMPRSEYNILCEVAKVEIKHPYFWQTEDTDSGSARGHAQLRNSLTTCILKSEESYKYPFNQGVFIDIFPLDNVPDDATEQRGFIMEVIKRYAKSKIERNYNFKIHLRKNIFKLMNNIFKYYYRKVIGKTTYKKYYREFEKLVMSYNYTETDYLCLCPNFKEANLNHRKDFTEVVLLPFEFISIPVASGYDRMLTQNFGNWHEYVKGTSVHGEMFFDVRKPYTEYVK